MKLAAARALAELAREPVPDCVAEAYGVHALPLRARLHHPQAVRHARALVVRAGGRRGGDGVGRRARLTLDLKEYRERLQRRARRRAVHDHAARIVQRAKNAPKRIVFPDGDNIKVLRACQIVLDEGIARPILLGRPRRSGQRADELDARPASGVEIIDPADSPKHSAYAHEYLDAALPQGRDRRERHARSMNRRTHYRDDDGRRAATPTAWSPA